MKPKYSISSMMLPVVAFLVMAMAMVSCRDTESGPVSRPGEESPMTLGFILTVGDTPASRAPQTPEGGYDRGEGYENYIDIPGRDFRFWFFDAESGRFLDSLQVNGVLPLENTATAKRYQVLASLGRNDRSFDPSRQSFKVVVLANWKNYPAPQAGITSIDDICSDAAAIFAHSPESNLPSEENPIPLYGVKDFLPVEFDYNNFASLGRIHLLRAYAKIEVIAAEESRPLVSAVLTRCNLAGYKAPKGVYSESDYVHDSYDDDYLALPTIPASVEVATDIPFRRNDADGSYTLYVPEFDNLTDRSKRAQISLRFEDLTENDIVEFRDYSKPDGEPFSLLRNNWYRFTVNKEPGTGLKVVVQVVPYAEVELGPEFGIDDGFDGLVPIFDENQEIKYYYDPLTGVYYTYNKVDNSITKYEGDPYFESYDPGTGYVIIRDDWTGNINFYYDEKNDIYYLPDKQTRCHNPYRDVALNPSGRFQTVARRDNNLVLYYIDRKNGSYYATDANSETATHLTIIWSTKRPGIVGMRSKAIDEQGNLAPLLYLDSATGKWYSDAECTKEIPRPYPEVYYQQ